MNCAPLASWQGWKASPELRGQNLTFKWQSFQENKHVTKQTPQDSALGPRWQKPLAGTPGPATLLQKLAAKIGTRVAGQMATAAGPKPVVGKKEMHCVAKGSKAEVTKMRIKQEPWTTHSLYSTTTNQKTKLRIMKYNSNTQKQCITIT